MLDAAAVAADEDALAAYRFAAAGIRRCLELGDVAAEYGDAQGAAEYLIGALSDLGPELLTLAVRLPPSR